MQFPSKTPGLTSSGMSDKVEEALLNKMLRSSLIDPSVPLETKEPSILKSELVEKSQCDPLRTTDNYK